MAGPLIKRLFIWVFLLSGICFGQNVRYDAPFPSITTIGATPYLVANVPPVSPRLAVCLSPANTVPCSNYASTFTASGTVCPGGQQDTPQPALTSACQTNGDAQGNIGFWAAPGTYDYTVCVAASCFGPYTITLTAKGAIGSGTTNQFAFYNSATSITSDPNLTDNATTITSLLSLTTPQVNLSGNGGLTAFGPGSTLPSIVSGSGGFGIFTGGLPQCNVNGTWFYCAYLSVGGTALTQNQANFSNTTPAAPTNGLNVQWLGSGINISAAVVGDGNAAHALCGNGVFGTCTAGGATALSGLTAATGTNTLANGNNPQTWNFALTTNSINGFTFGETSAATGTGENVVGVNTLSASTATPLTVTQGSVTGTASVPAFTINSTFNNASLVGNVFTINLTNTSSNASSNIANWNVGGSPQFQVDTGGDLGMAGSLHMLQTTGTLQACGGSSISCQSSTNGSNGPIQAQGEDSTSTGASAKAGAAVFRGGIMNSTPAAGALEGVVQLGAGYLKGSAIAAVGDVVCGTTTAFTVTDCSHTGPAINIIGIANTTANPIGVVMDGTTLVKFDGATTIGDLACMGTTTDGQAHDNGTSACATAGTYIGVIIANSGTIQQMSGVSQASTAMSSTLALVQLHIGK